jgi:hypothetical protein
MNVTIWITLLAVVTATSEKLVIGTKNPKKARKCFTVFTSFY